MKVWGVEMARGGLVEGGCMSLGVEENARVGAGGVIKFIHEL